jgi:A/G-specific adenine glycosylase
VLARYYTVDGWPGATAVANVLWAHAEDNTPKARVAHYTQAMMDLGATVCTRTKPACDLCPLASGCGAFALGRQTDFPGRKPKRDKPRRKTCMVLLRHHDAVYLERRPPTGIWGGLYSFPESGSTGEAEAWCRETLGVEPAATETWSMLQHSFTHFDLDIVPVAIRTDTLPPGAAATGDGIWYSPADARQVGLAAPVKTLLELVFDGQVGEEPVLDALPGRRGRLTG